MKKIIFPCLFVFSLILFACKKNGNETAKEPVQFTIAPASTDAEYNIYLPGLAVNFTNSAKNSDDLSYQWRFGDGATATDFNASHIYSGPGTYTVWLTQYRGGVAVDSASNTVQVLGTPKVIKRSSQYNSHPTWIACYGDKIYVAGWQAGVDNFYNINERFITQYDTLWREQWTKTFSPNDGAFQRVSITSNGDLLIPVMKSTGNAKLIRMDAGGNIKWTWNSSTTDVSINIATEDKNGNIFMLGSKTYPDPFYTAYRNGYAIQLDASGKENWTYAWPGMYTMDYCARPVAVSDGYIIAGSKNGGCTPGCDSAHVAKISFDGKPLWNTVVPWAEGSGIAVNVFAVIDQLNRLQVVSARSRSYCTFDLNGKYLGSHAYGMNIDPVDVQVNKSGSLLVLGDDWGLNRGTHLLEFKADGSKGWTHNIYKTIGYFNFTTSMKDTWGISMTITNDNKALMTGRLVYYRPGSSVPDGVSIFVTHANANGKL